MVYTLYLLCALLLPTTLIRSAAVQAKQLHDYFEIQTLNAPVKQLFHATCFVTQREQDFLEPSKEDIIIRAAIVSGPDADFVNCVADEAQRIRLRLPHQRASKDSDKDLMQHISRTLIGSDTSKIGVAKQTSIAIISGQFPNRPPHEILVPKELSSYLDDLNYCCAGSESPHNRFQALKKYLAACCADAATVHEVPVLTPKKEAFESKE